MNWDKKKGGVTEINPLSISYSNGCELKRSEVKNFWSTIFLISDMLQGVLGFNHIWYNKMQKNYPMDVELEMWGSYPNNIQNHPWEDHFVIL